MYSFNFAYPNQFLCIDLDNENRLYAYREECSFESAGSLGFIIKGLSLYWIGDLRFVIKKFFDVSAFTEEKKTCQNNQNWVISSKKCAPTKISHF